MSLQQDKVKSTNFSRSISFSFEEGGIVPSPGHFFDKKCCVFAKTRKPVVKTVLATFLLGIPVRFQTKVRKQGWRCGESARLRPICWVCCWFSSLLREIFFRILRFFPFFRNQLFQIQTGHSHESVILAPRPECFVNMLSYSNLPPLGNRETIGKN